MSRTELYLNTSFIIDHTVFNSFAERSEQVLACSDIFALFQCLFCLHPYLKKKIYILSKPIILCLGMFVKTGLGFMGNK